MDYPTLLILNGASMLLVGLLLGAHGKRDQYLRRLEGIVR